jgi:phosphoribosyl 1,2-cyclic phosphodiesterase
MRCGEDVLIFDAGTGIRRLAHDLIQRGNTTMDLFLSHCHYDHIIGLPFFLPLFYKEAEVRLWSGHMHGVMGTEGIVREFMRQPFFPVGPEVFSARVDYRDFAPGDRLEPRPGIEIETAELNHPGGAVGYRVTFDGRTAAYVTDHEQNANPKNEGALRLMKDADLVIFDATYTDEELPTYKGFGHSSWQQGLALCESAHSKRYVVFHHRPRRQDAALREIEAELKERAPQAVLARDDMVIEL